jgi:hypothetical protein
VPQEPPNKKRKREQRGELPRRNAVQDVNWTAFIIFLALFAFITWLGFVAAHWRKGDALGIYMTV